MLAVACAARATDATPLPLPGTIDDTVRRIEHGGRPRDRGADQPRGRRRGRGDGGDDRVEQLGPVDILVNNAAITFPGDLDLPMKRFDLIFAVDLRAPVIAARPSCPA